MATRKKVNNIQPNELRKIIRAFLEKNFEQLQKDFDAMEPKDRANAYLRLMEYALPKAPKPQKSNSLFNLNEFD